MSIRVMTAVWDQADLSGTELLALLALADWADDEGRAWPSYSRLATKIRASRRTAIRVIKKLEAEGHLTKSERQQTDGSYGTTMFVLTPYAKSSGAKPVDGDTGDTRGGVTDDTRGSDTRDTRGSDTDDTRVVSPMSPPSDTDDTRGSDTRDTRVVTMVSPYTSIEPSVEPSETQGCAPAAPEASAPRVGKMVQPHIALIDVMADELGLDVVDYARHVRDAKALLDVGATPEKIRETVRWVMAQPGNAEFFRTSPFSMTTCRKYFEKAMSASTGPIKLSEVW